MSKRERFALKHRKLTILAVLATMLLLVLPLSAQPRTIWVATNGTDAVGGNFGTEANPFRTIQYAVNYSYQFTGEDTVMVKPGTYLEHIFITSGPVFLKGQGGSAVTTIDGSLTGNCIETYYGTSGVTIEGFTITRGVPHGIHLPGVEGFGTSPTIRYCNIFRNGSSTSGTPGAGIRMEYSQASIHNNVIKENWTQAGGAGISAVYSSPHIYANDIDSNWSILDLGAGILLLGAYQDTIPAQIQNNIFRGNRSNLDGGAIYVDDAALPNIFNNLFIEGTCDNGNGGGIGYLPGANPLIQNNIFVGNSDYAIDCNGSGVPVLNNCFYNNLPNNLMLGSCPTSVSNLVGVDPLFVNESERNYHLRNTSPLIDAGQYVNGMFFGDYDGASRWVGANPDIGPFENCQLVPDFTWAPLSPCVGQSIDTDFLISGSWYRTIWDWGDGDVDTVDIVEEFAPTKIYTQAGIYNIKMTASCDSDTQSVTKTITVLGRPEVAFVANDTTVCVGVPVAFTNNTVTASTTYLWQFGDGDTDTSASPSHTYTSTGVRLVRLIGTNLCGPDTTTLSITVSDKPNASFVATPLSGSAPLLVNFNGTVTNPATSWSWNFGNGASAHREDTLYTYDTPGVYSVDFTAANDCGPGTTATQPNYIRVSGFDMTLASADTVSNNFRRIYTVQVDTIFGLYNRRVNLTAAVIPSNPRRGRATVTLNKSQVAVPEQFIATVVMDSVLAAGDYQLRIIGTSTANLPTDTISFFFRSNPIPIASIAPLTLDFDSVQVDELEIDTVVVTNQIANPFASVLSLAVFNVTSDNPAFVPLVTATASNLLPGASFYIPVRFDPEVVQDFSGTLTIQTNDPVTEFFEVDLVGIGIPERKPPKIVTTAPLAEADQVLVGSSITIDISEPLDITTLAPSPLFVRSKRLNLLLGGTLNSINQNTRLQFLPTGKLPAYDTIEVRLNGTIEDLSGNSLDGNNNNVAEGTPLDDYSFRFVTGPAVFPGDCNNDGKVNEMDILPLGIFFAVEGPRRDLFGEGNSFAAKQAIEWTDKRATYADANGDGVIDVTDLLVISTNWELTHPSAAPLNYGDLNLAEYAEGFRQLRPSLIGFAGTDRGDRMLELVNSLASDVVLPKAFSLLQNFPNPFNPQTSISYGLPEGVNVRVTIHNILGQRVRLLVDSYQEPGFKNVVWDGTDENGRQVSSGLYFYRLEAGEFVAVRKMMKLQ